jgi:hypothetical protein
MNRNERGRTKSPDICFLMVGLTSVVVMQGVTQVIGEPIKINRIEEFALVAAKGREARHAFGRYTGILFSR